MNAEVRMKNEETGERNPAAQQHRPAILLASAKPKGEGGSSCQKIRVYPCPSVVKRLKLNKGKLKAFVPPGGFPAPGAPGLAPSAKNPFIFNHFARIPAAQNHRNLPLKTCSFITKNCPTSMLTFPQ
jgi:hypothetical protein